MEPLTTPTTKDALLAQIRDEYATFVALVEQLSPAQRLEPISGSLSLKDIVAHISDWEAWMLLRMRSASAGEALPPRAVESGAQLAPGSTPEGAFVDIDAVNAAIYERFKDADWQTVWNDFQRTHEESLVELEQMSERDLFDPLRVHAVTGLNEGAAVDMILGNTSEHYREHADELRAAFTLA
jgi:hypothetical protein